MVRDLWNQNYIQMLVLLTAKDDNKTSTPSFFFFGFSLGWEGCFSFFPSSISFLLFCFSFSIFLFCGWKERVELVLVLVFGLLFGLGGRCWKKKVVFLYWVERNIIHTSTSRRKCSTSFHWWNGFFTQRFSAWGSFFIMNLPFIWPGKGNSSKLYIENKNHRFMLYSLCWGWDSLLLSLTSVDVGWIWLDVPVVFK